MRIAVLGARGQLGGDLCLRLPGQIVPLCRSEVDLDRPETIATGLTAICPDVIINCAAYNFVDRAETEPEAAFRTNVWGVRELARVSRSIGSRLVHFSTDYVFGLDETRVTPFQEEDPPGPVSVYGLSKLAGEYLIRGTCPDTLVIRTCGLYGVRGSGGKGGNFVETMIRKALEGKPLSVVNDQRCTPTYTVDLANTITELVKRDCHGVYHVTNSGDCTWHEFAAEIFRLSNLRVDLKPISSVDFVSPARRPRFSVLSTVKLIQSGIGQLPSWQDSLRRYLVERVQAKHE